MNTEEPKVLNWESTEETTWNTQEETSKTFTQAEVQEMIEASKRELQSASEKWVQKLINTNKTFENALTELSKIADDNSYLINLADTKPEVAKIILDKFYWLSLDEYKEQIWYEEDLSDPKVLERKADKIVQKKLEAKTIEDKTNSFVSKLQMTEEEKKNFLEAFEERKELKSFKIDDIDKHLEKAYKEISDKPLPKTQEVIAKVIATNEWKSSSSWPSKTDLDKSREEARALLSKYGI